jgi:hypothetical protein
MFERRLAERTAMNIWQRSVAPVVFVIFVIAACSGHPVAPDMSPTPPAWVTSLIHQFESEPVANPPASVARYEYKGREVYFVPQRCCDIMSDVYSADGAILCHPDGGFTGKGDGMCADFFAARRNEHIVWQDARR